MSGAFSKVAQRSSVSAVVASGAEMARSRSEARLAVPVAREPKTRTSRTAGNRRQAARNTARSLFRKATGFICLIPRRELEPLDDGIAEDGGFRLGNGFLQACGSIANLRLAFDESFFAHHHWCNMEGLWMTTPDTTSLACSRRRGRSAGAWGRRRCPRASFATARSLGPVSAWC